MSPGPLSAARDLRDSNFSAKEIKLLERGSDILTPQSLQTVQGSQWWGDIQRTNWAQDNLGPGWQPQAMRSTRTRTAGFRAVVMGSQGGIRPINRTYRPDVRAEGRARDWVRGVRAPLASARAS